MRRRAACAVLLCAALGTACDGASRTEERAPLRVYAAASLTDLLEALEPGLEAAAGRPVRFTTGASGTLARQILRGAPADLFISAHPAWMAEVDAAGLLAAGANRGRTWVRNRLVCVVPRESAWTPVGAANLAGGRLGSLALAAPTAPVGVYAREALAAAGVELPARVVEGLNARDTLAKLALGAADAGIVYRTDVRLEPRVRVAFTFDEALHGRIGYPAAVLARTTDPAACARAIEYLHGAAARAAIVAHGFTPA